jgi:hypothetical protein
MPGDPSAKLTFAAPSLQPEWLQPEKPNVAKHILTGRASSPQKPAGRARVAEAFSRFVAARPWIERCVVHVETDDITEAQGPYRNSDGVDVLVELWTADDMVIDATQAPLADVAAYRVEEIVEKGDANYPVGPLSGITILARLSPKANLTLEQARQGYDRHPLTALRVHGMDEYSRNWTQKVETTGATPFMGFSVLHYASDEGRLERHYDSPAGRDAISLDLDGFLDKSKLLVMDARSYAVR